MARDAISRQYDVDKNSVILTGDTTAKGGYKPGLITFHAKKGKSVDLEKLRASIEATRLSGGTNMRVDWLEITARGQVSGGPELHWKVSGTDQEFVLAEEPGAKGVLQKLRDAQARGTPIASVTGRVQGWKGRFPDVLKAMAPKATAGRPQTLLVTGFEIGGK